MGKGKQFLLLLWKNVVLLKRSPVRAFFQISMPLFFIIILVVLRASVVKVEPKPSRNYSAFDIVELPPDVNQTKLAFTPNTSDVRQIMDLVAKQLVHLSVVGFQNEREMQTFLVNEEEQNNGKEKKKRRNVSLGGIVFNRTLYSRNIIYKIRLSSKARGSGKSSFGASPSTSWLTQLTFPVFQKPGPRTVDNGYGGPPPYYSEGFLSLQHAVDSAIVKYIGNISALNTTVSMKRFPYPHYIHDEFVLVIQNSLPLLLMLSLIFTALNIVQDIVYEKEKKLKESMKMMGLNGWLHWLAWFTKYFIFLVITMALAAVFFTVKFSERGRILNQSSRSVIFVFFLLYSISSIMFCFCISVFFSKANIAAAAGGILWFMNYIPYFFIQQSYDTMGLGSKLASCLLSNVAMSLGAQLIGKFEGEGTGVQWSNLNRGPSIDDDLTLGYVFWMFAVDSVVYGLIAWYVEAVFPGDYGVPQPWYFPVLPSYWCGKSKEVEVCNILSMQNGTTPAATAPEFLEKDPVGLERGVEIRNLKKVFSTEKGKKTAVNGVSLNLYEGQITVLLGHNGAGKTTLMSMLTGLFPATSGSALVNGCSISDNISGVRSSLGLCPQHDVLFDRLTVEEHLWFFAKLKTRSSWQVKKEVDRMIECIGLSDKRQTQARALSGGMKRKLSVGIALIGGSKVVMLDEPTSGMDPSARRFTWDLLQQHKEGRTILLTTHFMDEADILGDRIAIMAEGNVKCCGSSLFLKNRYGVGYHMVIVKEPSCDVSKVTAMVTSHVPTATVESNIGAELSFILPSEASGNFENLFLELETRRKELGIASYGASVTTMEEVFLKVGEEMDSSLSDKLQQNSKGTPSANGVLDRENIPVPSEKSSVMARMGTVGASSAGYGTFGDYNNYNHTSGFRLFRQRWYAMFVKRILHSKRHKLALISQLLLPLVYTLFALISAKTIPQPTDSPPLTLSTQNFLNNSVPYECDNSTCSLADKYKTQWSDESKTHPVKVEVKMGQYLLEKPSEIGVGPFNKRDLIAATFQKQNDKVNVTAWFNNQAYHSIAVSLAAADNAILRAALGSNYTLTTVNHPLPRTAKESANDLQRNGVGFNVAFNILFGMAFLASSFVVFLVQERSNKAKHVQFVSGVDPFSYWDSAYTWDLINFLLPTLSLLILVAAFDVPAYTGARLGYLFILLMLYGWAIIPLMYLFSFLYRTASTAFVVLTVFNIITGLATLLTVFVLSIPELDLEDVADGLKWAFLVLPNYCLGQGISDIFNNYNTLRLVDQECHSKAKFLPLADCEKMAKEFLGPKLKFQTNYLAWDNPGIGRYLVFLALEGIVFYSLVLLIEYGAFSACARFFKRLRAFSANVIVSQDSHSADDDDVLEEKERVMRSTDKDDVLVIRELSKVFYGNGRRSPLVAVDSLSLGVPMNECFGLLGINGAGKTTTFRMLTGDETMTSGTALVEGFDIRTNMNKVRQRIGYCPQFDALIDQMTGREILYMYARLRGVPEVIIPDVVDTLIQSLLLQDHADKVAGSYSGGNKRKLSTAISLVGDPPVVFLDEPTTGMDPVARRLLWDALSRVRADGRCIVITSHSMEECEALCTRLAIMVNGRFKCLGSPQHLKTKFGEGYTVLARVGSDTPDTGPLKQFIEGTFPGSVLKDEHQGMVHYHIRDTSVSWAQLFGTIERVKMNYNIEDYSVSQTTLEQVFLNFARGQRAEDE